MCALASAMIERERESERKGNMVAGCAFEEFVFGDEHTKSDTHRESERLVLTNYIKLNALVPFKLISFGRFFPIFLDQSVRADGTFASELK